MTERVHDHSHEHGHGDAHAHAHAHAHDHDHDHAHAHAHEQTVEFASGSAVLSSHMHDQAATVSATLALAPGAAVGFAQLADVLQEIATQSESAGGIVGHIKAYAESDGKFAHASCTDAALGTTCQGECGLVLDDASKAQLVAIVMLVDLNELEGVVIQALQHL